MTEDILSPMNHREIEYNAKKLSGCDIPDNIPLDTRVHKKELLDWLDKTGKQVFDSDLIMDYGTDCLRLYLLFESTPKEHDAPYYDSWKEGALEGLYKFLSRYRRLILVANAWNQRGNYSSDTLTENSLEKMRNAIEETNARITKCINRGNTAQNRHNIVAALMELLNILHKGLKIGEAVSVLHAHAIETAVPHSTFTVASTKPQEAQQESQSIPHNIIVTAEKDGIKNRQSNCGINLQAASLCSNFIILIAPYAPYLSKILWNNMMTIIP